MLVRQRFARRPVPRRTPVGGSTVGRIPVGGSMVGRAPVGGSAVGRTPVRRSAGRQAPVGRSAVGRRRTLGQGAITGGACRRCVWADYSLRQSPYRCCGSPRGRTPSDLGRHLNERAGRAHCPPRQLSLVRGSSPPRSLGRLSAPSPRPPARNMKLYTGRSCSAVHHAMSVRAGEGLHGSVCRSASRNVTRARAEP